MCVFDVYGNVMPRSQALLEWEVRQPADHVLPVHLRLGLQLLQRRPLQLPAKPTLQGFVFLGRAHVSLPEADVFVLRFPVHVRWPRPLLVPAAAASVPVMVHVLGRPLQLRSALHVMPRLLLV